MGDRSDRNLHFWLHSDQQRWFVLMVLTIIATIFVSALCWLYIILAGNTMSIRVLRAELISNAIVLVGSIYCICRVGYYDSFWKNVGVTLAVTIVITIIGFYISKVQMLPAAQKEGTEIFVAVMQFLSFFMTAAVLAVIPVLATCGLMYLIMSIFGKKE